MEYFSNLVRALVIMTFFVSVSIGSNGLKEKNDNEYSKIVPGQFIVKFKPDAKDSKTSFSKLSSVAATFNTKSQKQMFKEARNEKVKRKLNLENIFVFETDRSSDIQKIVAELNSRPDIEYAEPVYLNKIEAVPDDPLYSDQYALPQISAPAAWDIKFGSSDVIIGILDTGVDWDHEDLADNIWNNTGEIPDNGVDDDANGYIDDIRGWDFVTGRNGSEDTQADSLEDGDVPDNDPMDFDGHGTHVSGIAGAVTNNGIGVASASAGATIMPLRVGYHANDGGGYVPSIFAAEAYVYAADNGAHITNQSSGTSGQAIVDASYYAFLNGVLIVESAGNGDAIDPGILGSQDFVLSVGSVNQLDEKTYYSSYGEFVDVSSPGGELFVGDDTWGHLSTIVNPSNFYGGAKYTKFQGTSMAAPLVASAAALVKSNEPTLSVVDLYTRIVETADNIDDANPDYVGLLGSGRINLERALNESVTATPRFKIVNSIIDDASGNNNGVLDPGEEVQLIITLRNEWANASGVNVNLSSENVWPVTVGTPSLGLGTITGVLDTTSWEADAVFTISATADAIPLSNSFQLEITSGGYSQTIDYNIAVSPQILFVADFEASGNTYLDHSQIYLDAFEANNISYDYVHHLDIEITSELLEKYSIVVWGCEWVFPSLDANDRDLLEVYLDGGGSLFLSGQDVAWDLNDNPDNIDVEFLNNYLKTNFLADDAAVSEIYGIDGDPISDGLEINFYQVKRDADQQFPDAIEPIDSAVSTMNYADGRSGAIRYSGDYNLVFFGFGGFEAITEEPVRNKVMKNAIDWLSGIDYSIEKLKDSEDTEQGYIVNLMANSRSSIISTTELYWDTDGELPFNKVTMTDLGEGKYSAEIPAQSEGSDIEYFAFAKDDNGAYIITQTSSFYIGADSEPPTIELITKPFANSINVYGPAPYGIRVNLDDNIGIDSSSAKIYYTVNEFEPYSFNQMNPTENGFEGSFEFSEPLIIGDKVSYYFEVVDASSGANKASTEVYEYYIDTLQVIDDFENGLADWELDGLWDLNVRRKQGEYSLTDSPDGFYYSNTNATATFLPSFNLTPYKYAGIDFFLRANLESGKDSILAEISNDGGISWNTEFGYSRSSTAFKQHKLDLTNYTGEGNEDVRFRFRLYTDEQGERDGVWIDTVTITVSYDVVGVEDEVIQLPKAYSLEQNYPNPFNPSTKINYSLPIESHVKIQIFNILGENVNTIVDNIVQAGSHSIEWNASNLSTGVYLYRINAESVDGSKNFNSVKKMILMK